MIKSFKNMYNFLFIACCLVIIVLYYQKCQERKMIEGLNQTPEIPNLPGKKENITVDTNMLRDIVSNLVTNEEIGRLEAKDPKYYEDKFTELNQQYHTTLEERRQAEIEQSMNPNNAGLRDAYLEKNSQLSEINAQFQSYLNEFIVDAENVKTYISNTDENVSKLLDENKEQKQLRDSLKGSDQTAKKMYTDYVTNYKYAYKTILFTILAIGLFYTVLYYEIKTDPEISRKMREIMERAGQTFDIRKLIISTMAVASAFALAFVFIYSLVRRLIREYVERKIDSGEEPQIYKIPSYSLNFNISERADDESSEETS